MSPETQYNHLSPKDGMGDTPPLPCQIKKNLFSICYGLAHIASYIIINFQERNTVDSLRVPLLRDQICVPTPSMLSKWEIVTSQKSLIFALFCVS